MGRRLTEACIGVRGLRGGTESLRRRGGRTRSVRCLGVVQDGKISTRRLRLVVSVDGRRRGGVLRAERGRRARGRRVSWGDDYVFGHDCIDEASNEDFLL